MAFKESKSLKCQSGISNDMVVTICDHLLTYKVQDGQAVDGETPLC